MSLLIRIVVVVWWLRIIRNTVAYVQLWWVKEYRFDRMWIHLRTGQGRWLLFPAYRGLRISPKTLTLVFVTFIFELIAFYVLPFHSLLSLVLHDLVTFPLIALFVLCISVPQRVYHAVVIQLAKRKLERHTSLLVIGITGSYGKTSTKEYLAAILSARFKVLKTEASKNSMIGIAEVILRNLNDQHEVFVVEMGAYQRGEIRDMCRFVRPEIGIITAINEQHQDLFGSMENTMMAKYELLENLSGKRIAILNSDNEYVQKMVTRAKRDGLSITTYGSSGSPDFRISTITQKAGKLQFTLRWRSEQSVVHAPVIGLHQAHNVTAAIAAAVSAGVPFRQAATAAAKLPNVRRMMESLEGVNGSVFIDDTFNNNPDAALAALDYLAETPGKKILVFQPLIELGPYAQSAHERVGKRAGEVCDAIILTNRDHYGAFVSGVKQKTIVHVLDPSRASQYIRSTVGPGDTVIFKGKEAEKVLLRLV